MSNQRLMKVKEKAGDGYAKTNAIGPSAGDHARESHMTDSEACETCMITYAAEPGSPPARDARVHALAMSAAVQVRTPAEMAARCCGRTLSARRFDRCR